MTAWSVTSDGLAIAIRLTPRGGRDGLDCVETLADGRQMLKARVRAAPSEGEANAALIALLAKELSVSRSQISLTAGASARLKRILILGEGAALAARLQKRLCEI
jgi:uncharacterized protein YggU (UPF0235/DUF167 family)